MAWNQPGGSGDRDPWGQRGGQQQPPDLDEIVKNVQRKLGGIFGGGGGSGGAGSGGGIWGIGLIALVVIALFAVYDMIYIVRQGEAGVVLQLGKYKETTSAGLHFRLPRPIEQHEIVNVAKVDTVPVGYRDVKRTNQASPVPQEALMLTMDENIIDIQFAVQYRIKDPKNLLFKVSEPTDLVVRAATEAAVREIVGRSTMDFVLTTGRDEVAKKTQGLLQEMLDRYETGIEIVTVEMQNAQPPAEVKAAFDDAVKAREDQERLKNEAEAYRNDIIPRARGQAARLTQEAEAYQARVIARAQGEAKRFDQILTEYRKAPKITRERLYIETMEQVLQNSSKMMIDQTGGNNIIYLPLDRIVDRPAGQLPSRSGSSGAAAGAAPQTDSAARRGRSDLRSRRN